MKFNVIIILDDGDTDSDDEEVLETVTETINDFTDYTVKVITVTNADI